MKCSITKAAALVLLWTLCGCTATFSIGLLVYSFYGVKYSNNGYTNVLRIVVPFIAAIPALPISGWLADSRFGNFKVFRAGCTLLFLGSVLSCVSILVVVNLSSQASFITSTVIGTVSQLFSFSGGSAFLVTVFQLGLDQMPDASSTGITSFILWFGTIYLLGFWIAASMLYILRLCTDYSLQTLSLLPVLCMCVLLSSLYLFGDKWLIIEPNSPQSLKSIYRIVKFAVNHKAPLNRSALTYWEENIPSRLDLGKSKYGGPFTTEQVEDVKSFFRLLLLFLPIWISVTSNFIFCPTKFIYIHVEYSKKSTENYCLDSLYQPFMYGEWFCAFTTLFVYTICVYPCFKYRLPSILKQLGFYLFLLLFFNIFYSFTHYYFYLSNWPEIVHNWLYIPFLTLMLTSSIEFLCAQSPYNIRGLLSGINWFMLFLSGSIGILVLKSLDSKSHLIILYSVGCGISVAGFLLYMIAACRYKRRVRDEEYHPQTHIEAIYDRYLTQAQQDGPGSSDMS